MFFFVISAIIVRINVFIKETDCNETVILLTEEQLRITGNYRLL